MHGTVSSVGCVDRGGGVWVGRVERLFARILILSCTRLGAVHLPVFWQERFANQRFATMAALETFAVPMPCDIVVHQSGLVQRYGHSTGLLQGQRTLISMP